MIEELCENIRSANIPELLKDYLLRIQRVQLPLNSKLLRDIEEIYIEYDSLYFFDKAKFSGYVITGLKKQDKYDYFYNYLKIVMESNLRLISKHQYPDYEVLKRMAENIDPKEKKIPRYIENYLLSINTYEQSKDIQSLFTAFRISGILELMFDIYPGHPYSDDFKRHSKLLEGYQKTNKELSEKST